MLQSAPRTNEEQAKSLGVIQDEFTLALGLTVFGWGYRAPSCCRRPASRSRVSRPRSVRSTSITTCGGCSSWGVPPLAIQSPSAFPGNEGGGAAQPPRDVIVRGLRSALLAGARSVHRSLDTRRTRRRLRPDHQF